jgi:SNF2 family DNA or RNA helicase
MHVLLLNVEALGRDLASNRAYDFLHKFLLGHRALLAIDESTAIKNPQATRTKALMKLRLLAPYRRILSGMPDPNGPLDLYSQCWFLDPDLLGYGSFYSYKAHFARLVPMRVAMGNGQSRRFNKITGYQNLDELHKILSKFAFIVKKEDCLDLPEKLPAVKRNVEMGPKQRRAYNDMRSMAIVEIERHMGALRDGTPTLQQPMDFQLLQQCQGVENAPPPDPSSFSTASLVITQMLRLHQILCGFIVTDDRKPVLFDEPNPRLEDLIDQLAETSGTKVVIWATYRVNVRQIAERIAKEYGPESVVTYYGPTSVDERRAAIREFQDPDSPVKYFVSNKTGAKGITLTASHTAIYYSYDHDAETHSQSLDRIHRIGQHWPCSYVFQRVPGTLEDKILDCLAGKLDISKQITASNWRDYL